MTSAEKICKVLVARNQWSDNNCFLCRKINRTICPILIEQENREHEERSRRFDERNDFAREGVLSDERT